MGEVYKARDTRLDRTVAIKVLPAAFAMDPQFRDRFDREAKAISALDHPHICALYDVGEQDGTSFLVMQCLEGETLADWLGRSKGRPLPMNDALTIAIQIADALDNAHRHGITHRDLKPGNIMLTKAGAKLLDFGLAKVGPAQGPAKTGHYVRDGVGAGDLDVRGVRLQPDLSAAPTMTSPITAQGTILGTFQYMAPEQIEGQEADARSDIFAFGAVLYEMLTGKKAFEGKTQASLIAAILEREPAPISTLQPLTPRALDRVVKKCLAKEPDQRWQTAKDLHDELNWVIGGGSSSEAATMPRPGRPAQKLAIGAAMGLTLVLLAVVPLVISHLRETSSQPRPVRFAVPLPDGTNFGVALPTISVSPDGRSIAFTAQTAGMIRIWLHRLDELASRPLPGTEGAVQAWPIWSPDSSALAFVTRERRTLKRIDIPGGSATDIGSLPPVVGNAPSGTWNRNGEILLAAATGGILRVSTATGQMVPVTFVPQPTGVELSPVFLPDGRRFLYSRQGGADPGIYFGSLDSHDTHRLLPYGGTVQISEGVIFYSRGAAVVAQPFDAQKATLAGEPVVIVDNVSSGAASGRASFSVSQKGVLVYSAGNRVNSQFAWLSRAGQQVATIGEVGSYSTLSLSGDEHTLVTARVDQNGGQNLWAIDLIRQVTTRLTFAPDRDSDGRLSPDGKRLIYASMRGTEKSLYEIPASGGPSRLVLKAPEGHQLSMDAWSPDGRMILYHPDATRQMWALPMEGNRKPFLVYEPAGGVVDEPTFSPDGKWIAFNSSESGTVQVYVVPFPTTGAKWQVSGGGGVQPHWRRDGRELYFVAPDGKLMAVDVRLGDTFEAGTPHALFQGTSGTPSSISSDYVVTADGQWFGAMRPVGASQSDAIQVITDWAGLLKK